ncbi:FAD-dependent monooxygenase [Actinomycetospora lutea]|uniref:NAD(P)/FAD-dependent oxidoreductase n=1 Tax=Actinomycetospora lutea TaxID=663604 RepID=UPI002366CD74|nr:FAD-dependent monooxygenase [Actinomycetospora lutea]MDD7942918.1 FAD-dependent monooxygenase [Actinomycetospora lutea]
MYDAIVVGARCAGAATAMLLARAGHRVLLVDRATFPSDMPQSNHLVWPPGVAALQRWGLLGELVGSGCPALTTGHIDLGPFVLSGGFPPSGPIDAAYAPRRKILDAILVEAAVGAGAELWEACSVDELLVEDSGPQGPRVRGIGGRGPGGQRYEAAATIVIGADGMRSTVARLVDAPLYLERPASLGTFFSYWSGVPTSTTTLYPRPYRSVVAFPTHDELTVVSVNFALEDFHAAAADRPGAYFRALDEIAPELAEQMRAGRREGRWIGSTVPGFFRRPYGPGWALVGDAGYLKDPCTAQGITDAFHHAELLAEALDAALREERPTGEALAGYERRRNAAVMPMYEFTCQRARLEPPTPEMQAFFAGLRDDPRRTERFFGVFAGTVPVTEFFGSPAATPAA